MEAEYSHTISPDVIRQLWAVINHLQGNSIEPTLNAISTKAEESFQWTFPETESNLVNCVNSKFLELDDSSEFREHDCFCYVCHEGGFVMPCHGCFRVFHNNCASGGTDNSTEAFVCPVCQMMLREPKVDPTSLREYLEPIDESVGVNEYYLLIARNVDLSSIRQKLETGQYHNAKDFLLDFQLLLHNVIVVYGISSNIAQIASDVYQTVYAQIDSENVEAEMEGTEEGANEEAVEMSDAQLEYTDEMHALPSDVSQAQLYDESIIRDLPPHNCPHAPKFKRLIKELHDTWQLSYHEERDRLRNAIREKLTQKFMREQAREDREMQESFSKQLEESRQDLQSRYNQQLKAELKKLSDRHQRQLNELKKKQWVCHQA
ncbi:putative Bromodomain protein [Trichinella nativa]|uniref:Putative Bromodomain protein n=1 Tax=Trichinella nativa TaxID=6335 RepID=A0A1Y3EU16_9BILA|nr:putative Bromodomain protein [Trichinella nativa]